MRHRPALSDLIDSKMQQSFGLMVDSKKNHLLRDAELNAFKLSNNLFHPATYPKDLASHMSWVLVALVLETIINASFFAGASGLIIGAMVALSVSAVNLGISFIAGVFFRDKNSISHNLRIQGWLIFLNAWFILIALNLLTAAYRSASAELLSKMLVKNPLAAVLTSQTEAFQLALTNIAGILNGHFPFADLNGLILMFVGLLAGIVGMWKGYTADDPYPKYGLITRNAVEAAKKYEALEKDLRSEANSASSEPLKDILDSRQAINSIQKQHGACTRDAKDLKNEWQQEMSKLTHEYVSIVDVYRKAIKAVKPNPAPAYFEYPVELPQNDQLLNTINELDNRLIEIKAEIEDLTLTGLPYLAEAEQLLNKERTNLLGNVLNEHLSKITQAARDTISGSKRLDILNQHESQTLSN